MTTTSDRIDISDTLRQTIAIFWLDFAPITLLGLGFLVLPELISQALLTGEAADSSLAIILQIAGSILKMLYVCVVNYGAMARLCGQPLDAETFIREGLRAAQPGMFVALLLGVFGMLVGILDLLMTRNGIGITVLCYLVLIWGLIVWLPAVPTAIVEHASPIAALKRAAALTRGQRVRLIGLLFILGLAVLSIVIIMMMILFGSHASPQVVQRTIVEWSLLSPGLWIMLLIDMLVSGALAPLPAVVYARLAAGRRS